MILIVMMNSLKLEILSMMIVSSLMMMKSYYCDVQFEYNWFFMDSMSMSMCTLSLTLLCLSTSIYRQSINKSKNILCFISGLLAIMMFQSSNLMFLFISFEASLIPLSILLFCWGKQPERVVAGNFIMAYTLVSAFPLLCLMVYFEETEGMFSMFNNLIGSNYNNWLWMTEIGSLMSLSFGISFLVKVPIFLFHSWLPKAHVESPLEGSIILAGIMLKVGIYGIIRMVNLFPINFLKWMDMIFSVSIVGSVVSIWMAVSSDDVKMSVAMSSISHMNFLLCSITPFKELSITFSVFTMVAHGLVSSMLFYFVTLAYEQYNSRSLVILKGSMNSNPSLMLFTFILFSLSIAIPPSLSFLGELMSISSIVNYSIYSSMFIVMFMFFNSYYSIMNYGIFFHSSSFKKPSPISTELMYNLFSIIFVYTMISTFFFPESI